MKQLQKDPIFATNDQYIRFQIVLNYFNAQKYSDPSGSMLELFFRHLVTLPNSFTKSQAGYKLGKILDL